MNRTDVKEYYEYHNENIDLLNLAFKNIRFQIKELYKQKHSTEYIYSLPNTHPNKKELLKLEKALSRILAGIQVSWAEESLKRLLYEDKAFSNNQRNYLLNLGALDQRWYKTLKIAFSIAFDLVPINDELCETVNIKRERRNLGDELVDSYLSLKRIITQQLTPNFTLRNKVQHGEWLRAFKDNSTIYSTDLTNKVNKENIITTTSRFTIVNALYQMMVDLVRFKSDRFALNSIETPFEYFNKKYFYKINHEVKKLENASLDKFIEETLQRMLRGEKYRKK